MKKKIKNIAASDTVGTLLLLLMTVTLFSGIYICIVTIYPSDSRPSVNLIGTIENNNITLDHRGGKTLDLNVEIIVSINGTDNRFTVNEYIEDRFKNDGKWDCGERLIYPAGDVENLNVEVTVVDPQSKSVIMMAKLQE